MNTKPIVAILLCIFFALGFSGCSLKEMVEQQEQSDIASVGDAQRMMYYGVKNNNIALVDYAVKNGADLSILPKVLYEGSGIGYGNTVHEAIFANSFPNWEMLQYLVESGAETNYVIDTISDIPMLMGIIKSGSVLNLQAAVILAEAPQTDINATDSSGHNALFWAIDIAVNNENADLYLRLISTLLENGAEVTEETLMKTLNPYNSNETDFAGGDGLYPMTKLIVEAADVQKIRFPYSDILHDAIIGDTSAVYEKVKNGDLKEIKSEYEKRAVLFFTAAYGSLDTLKLIMSECSYDFDVERIDGNLVCPHLLDAAILGNNVNTTEYLISNGADINSSDNNKIVPLYRAVQLSNYETAELLFKHDAGLYSSEMVEFEHGSLKKEYYSNFVFEEMANNQDYTMLQLFLNNDYNFDEMSLEYSDESGNTRWDRFAQLAYNSAIEKNNLNNLTKFYHVLIEDGHVNANDLVVYDDIDCCKLLVENGYHPSEHSEQMVNAVSDVECIKYLIENGGDVNALTPDQYFNPTEYSILISDAVRYGYYDTVKYLIENGADINTADCKRTAGYTPLHYAVFSTPEILEFLLINGADINAEDNNGETALTLAKKYYLNGQVEILNTVYKQS